MRPGRRDGIVVGDTNDVVHFHLGATTTARATTAAPARKLFEMSGSSAESAKVMGDSTSSSDVSHAAVQYDDQFEAAASQGMPKRRSKPEHVHMSAVCNGVVDLAISE